MKVKDFISGVKAVNEGVENNQLFCVSNLNLIEVHSIRYDIENDLIIMVSYPKKAGKKFMPINKIIKYLSEHKYTNCQVIALTNKMKDKKIKTPIIIEESKGDRQKFVYFKV